VAKTGRDTTTTRSRHFGEAYSVNSRTDWIYLRQVSYADVVSCLAVVTTLVNCSVSSHLICNS